MSLMAAVRVVVRLEEMVLCLNLEELVEVVEKVTEAKEKEKVFFLFLRFHLF